MMNMHHWSIRRVNHLGTLGYALAAFLTWGSRAHAAEVEQTIEFSGLTYRSGDSSVFAPNPQMELEQVEQVFRSKGSKLSPAKPASTKEGAIQLRGAITMLQCDGDPKKTRGDLNCILGVEWSLSVWD